MTLDEEIERLRSEAYQIYARAALGEEPRDFTADEERRFTDLMDRKEALEVRKRDQSQRSARLAGYEARMGAVAPTGKAASPNQSLGSRFVDSPQFRAFQEAFPGGVPKGVHVDIGAVRIDGGFGGFPTKANEITTGQFPSVPQLFVYPDLMGVPRPPLNVLGLVTHGAATTDVVAFPRLNSYTDATGAVAELAPKPQSTLDYTLITTPIVTYAHWVAASKQALADRSQLETLINTFLTGGVNQAIETAVVQDIVANAQAATTTAGATLMDAARQAITSLENKFIQPTAFVFSPADAETIDLAKDGVDRYYGAGPFGMGPNTLWGLPRVTSFLLGTTGTGIVGDFRYEVYWDRESASIAASDSHSDFFTKNLVAILGEARGVPGCLYPAAFASFDTTGGGAVTGQSSGSGGGSSSKSKAS
jgi:HK97 family phage major capsid protein